MSGLAECNRLRYVCSFGNCIILGQTIDIIDMARHRGVDNKHVMVKHCNCAGSSEY